MCVGRPQSEAGSICLSQLVVKAASKEVMVLHAQQRQIARFVSLEGQFDWFLARRVASNGVCTPSQATDGIRVLTWLCKARLQQKMSSIASSRASTASENTSWAFRNCFNNAFLTLLPCKSGFLMVVFGMPAVYNIVLDFQRIWNLKLHVRVLS